MLFMTRIVDVVGLYDLHYNQLGRGDGGVRIANFIWPYRLAYLFQSGHHLGTVVGFLYARLIFLKFCSEIYCPFKILRVCVSVYL